jgi:choline dehydrogenase-like flavoprotein
MVKNYIDQILDETFDYIIIGTGISGGTIGHYFSEQGKRVLFLEKGPFSITEKKEGGPECERKRGHIFRSKDESLLKSYSRYYEYIIDTTRKKRDQFIPLLGAGVGGSTSIYGAALERFFPEDFKPKQYFKKFKNASIIDWEFQYEDLEKYYEQAEKLYHVHGEMDPLRKKYQSSSLLKTELTPIGQELFRLLQEKRLHPYRLPVGHISGAKRKCGGCQAVTCPEDEKFNSYNSAIQSALKSKKIELLVDCEVIKINANENKVNSVDCIFNGLKYQFKAHQFILAAGAINTPVLLLKSKSQFWPKGLGNEYDLVGRFLCRHYMDLLNLKDSSLTRKPFEVDEKELAFNDLYFKGGEKLGTIQSLGGAPSSQLVLSELMTKLKGSSFPFLYFLLKLFCLTPLSSFFAKRAVSGVNLAMIMEDLPYYENRITIGEQGCPEMSYRVFSEGKSRLRLFRKEAKKIFSKYSVTLFKEAENNQRLAHSSGTCRMGKTKREGVVDSQNKVFGISNLYIVDASFFPSSAGINPALTLAANALRVGNYIEQKSKN